MLVTGATGFVGSQLCSTLAAAGHEVWAMTRRPGSYRGAGRAVFGDVADPASLGSALAGVEVAYYLVHSLDRDDFVAVDASGASGFAAAGVGRIVYLGGLGDDTDELSAHLRSRREVQHLLERGSVPVTTLRAGIIVGHGGISWEITRQLVAHLPVMVCPRWVYTQHVRPADVERPPHGLLVLENLDQIMHNVCQCDQQGRAGMEAFYGPGSGRGVKAAGGGWTWWLWMTETVVGRGRRKETPSGAAWPTGPT